MHRKLTFQERLDKIDYNDDNNELDQRGYLDSVSLEVMENPWLASDWHIYDITTLDKLAEELKPSPVNSNITHLEKVREMEHLRFAIEDFVSKQEADFQARNTHSNPASGLASHHQQAPSSPVAPAAQQQPIPNPHQIGDISWGYIVALAKKLPARLVETIGMAELGEVIPDRAALLWLLVSNNVVTSKNELKQLYARYQISGCFSETISAEPGPLPLLPASASHFITLKSLVTGNLRLPYHALCNIFATISSDKCSSIAFVNIGRKIDNQQLLLRELILAGKAQDKQSLANTLRHYQIERIMGNIIALTNDPVAGNQHGDAGTKQSAQQTVPLIGPKKAAPAQQSSLFSAPLTPSPGSRDLPQGSIKNWKEAFSKLLPVQVPDLEFLLLGSKRELHGAVLYRRIENAGKTDDELRQVFTDIHAGGLVPPRLNTQSMQPAVSAHQSGLFYDPSSRDLPQAPIKNWEEAFSKLLPVQVPEVEFFLLGSKWEQYGANLYRRIEDAGKTEAELREAFAIADLVLRFARLDRETVTKVADVYLSTNLTDGVSLFSCAQQMHLDLSALIAIAEGYERHCQQSGPVSRYGSSS